MTVQICDEAHMSEIMRVAHEDSAAGVDAIDLALATFPKDPRLHFLKGSLLIGLKQFIDAHQALSMAVRLAPEFQLARFQLGFFELTSGEAESALTTWQPLKVLPRDYWLRHFVEGLEHLAADRFAACVDELRAGIAANRENLPLNGDMQLIIVECQTMLESEASKAIAPEIEEISATSFLLGTSSPSKRRH